MSSPKGINWIFRVYKLFTLSENYVWDTGIAFDKNYEFRDTKKENKIRMTIDTSGRITVNRGYAWDGCTPKFSFIFFNILEDARFAPRRLYWLAVRLFGGIFMNTRKYITRKTEGAVTVMQEPGSKAPEENQ